MWLESLQRIRILRKKEFNELVKKLEAIENNKRQEWILTYQRNPNDCGLPEYLNFDDLKEALACCIYHFTGGFYESMGEICPCNCICTNCEMIPEHPVGVKMQEIGKTMGEENVMTEFIEKFAKENNDQKEC